MKRKTTRIMILGSATSVHVQKFVSIYQQKGFEVIVVTILPDERLKAIQYVFKSMNRGLSYLKLAFFFPILVRKIKPDIIHSHYTTFYGFIAAISRYKPHILSVYGSDLYKAHGIFNFLNRIALLSAFPITYDSMNLGKEIEKVIGMDKKKKRAVLLPFGVNTHIFMKNEINKTPDRFKVISTRHLEEIYDVKTLIYAIPEIVKAFPEIDFIVIGNGSQKQKLEDITKDLGVEGNVHFLGRFSEQKDFIQQFVSANIYVSTSLSDSTSVSLLEAISSCLVPVITDLPDNLEWIHPEINGFIFEPKNPVDLTTKIKKAIDNYPKMIEALKENRNTVIQRASIENTSKRIYKIINSLLTS
ncbi:MAG: glycosyltransferase family 4 protein [Promethearchaeota archaeon]